MNGTLSHSQDAAVPHDDESSQDMNSKGDLVAQALLFEALAAAVAQLQFLS